MNSTILEKKVKKLSEKIVKYQNQISILKESLNVAKESLRKEKKNKTKTNDAIKRISGGRNTVMKGGAIMRWRRSSRVAPEPVPTPNSPIVSPPRSPQSPPPPRHISTTEEWQRARRARILEEMAAVAAYRRAWRESMRAEAVEERTPVVQNISPRDAEIGQYIAVTTPSGEVKVAKRPIT